MLVEMITAEEARTKVHIDIMNNDLRQIKKRILTAINENKPSTLIIDDGDGVSNSSSRLSNRVATIGKLKELGYTIRQCPTYAFIFVVEWEISYTEDHTDMTLPANWPML
jgi:C4-type Zn-finger protein